VLKVLLTPNRPSIVRMRVWACSGEVAGFEVDMLLGYREVMHKSFHECYAQYESTCRTNAHLNGKPMQVIFSICSASYLCCKKSFTFWKLISFPNCMKLTLTCRWFANTGAGTCSVRWCRLVERSSFFQFLGSVRRTKGCLRLRVPSQSTRDAASSACGQRQPQHRERRRRL